MTRSQEELRRATFRLGGALAVATAIAALFDLGRYGDEFRQNGLLGFLCLPSVLVFQIGYLLFIGYAIRKSNADAPADCRNVTL